MFLSVDDSGEVESSVRGRSYISHAVAVTVVVAFTLFHSYKVTQLHCDTGLGMFSPGILAPGPSCGGDID